MLCAKPGGGERQFGSGKMRHQTFVCLHKFSVGFGERGDGGGVVVNGFSLGHGHACQHVKRPQHLVSNIVSGLLLHGFFGIAGRDGGVDLVVGFSAKSFIFLLDGAQGFAVVRLTPFPSALGFVELAKLDSLSGETWILIQVLGGLYHH